MVARPSPAMARQTAGAGLQQCGRSAARGSSNRAPGRVIRQDPTDLWSRRVTGPYVAILHAVTDTTACAVTFTVSGSKR
jgi:hypothetical protein